MGNVVLSFKFRQPGRVGAMVKDCERESLLRAGLQKIVIAIDLEFAYDGDDKKAGVICEETAPACDVDP